MYPKRTTAQGARTCSGGDHRLLGRSHRRRRAALPSLPSHCRRTIHCRPSQSPLCRHRRHPPPPTFADPFVVWLLRCFPPFAFIIACYHATVNALDAGRFLPPIVVHRRHRCHHRSCCHHLGRTHRCGFTKKETAAAPPPAYQLLHHRVNVYKSRQLGLI